MKLKKNGILVTGIPHGGTRLIVDILSKHINLLTYKQSLNSVNEFSILHQFYIDSMKKSNFNNGLIHVDQREFNLTLDKILDLKSQKTHVIKMPCYPLHHLNHYSNYFDNLKIIYAYRPNDKVIESYQTRNENFKQFNTVNKKINQLKKIKLEKRNSLLSTFNFVSWVNEMIDLNNTLIKDSNQYFKINTSKILEKNIHEMFSFLQMKDLYYENNTNKFLSVVDWNKANA